MGAIVGLSLIVDGCVYGGPVEDVRSRNGRDERGVWKCGGMGMGSFMASQSVEKDALRGLQAVATCRRAKWGTVLVVGSGSILLIDHILSGKQDSLNSLASIALLWTHLQRSL